MTNKVPLPFPPYDSGQNGQVLGADGKTKRVGWIPGAGGVGNRGIVGADGAVGPLGETGGLGEQGNIGGQGAVGNTGFQGAQGTPSSIVGPVGNVGNQGAQGNPGTPFIHGIGDRQTSGLVFGPLAASANASNLQMAWFSFGWENIWQFGAGSVTANFTRVGNSVSANGFVSANAGGNVHSVCNNFFGSLGPGGGTAPQFPAQLDFQQQPPELVNHGATFTVSVRIEDSFGNLVSGATNSVTLTPLFPGGTLLNGTLTRNAVGGVATFTGLSVTGLGASGLRIQATSSGLTSDTSIFFTMQVPVVATELRWVIQPPATITTNIFFNVSVEATNGSGTRDTGFTGSIGLAIVESSTPLPPNPFFRVGSTGCPGPSICSTVATNAVAGLATFNIAITNTFFVPAGSTFFASSFGLTGANSSGWGIGSPGGGGGGT